MYVTNEDMLIMNFYRYKFKSIYYNIMLYTLCFQ